MVHSEFEPSSLGTPAVRLAVRVLLAVAADVSGRGVRELARDLAMDRSAIHRVMVSLERAGMLLLNEWTQRYRLGPAAMALTRAFLQQDRFVQASLGPMNDLRSQTHETTVLAVRLRDRRLTVHQIEGPHSMRVVARIGSTGPLSAGASGRSILAFLPAEDQDRIVAGELADGLTFAGGNRVLRRRLVETRRLGYARSYAEVSDGAAIAAPIMLGGAPVASLTIAGPEERFGPKRLPELAPHVVAAASRISEALGGQPDDPQFPQSVVSATGAEVSR